MQLFFLYFVLPDYGIVLPAFLTGALALGIQYSAYTSEVYRAGIEAVDRGQHEAAKALDLPPRRTFTHIVLPQAVPRVVPALGNYLVSIMKDVPVLSVVTVLEMLNVAKIIGDQTFDYLVPLVDGGRALSHPDARRLRLVRFVDLSLPKRGMPLR